ncbi:D-glycero-beta-D-manno-heptose 1-phosphate adenylyltransferase [Candidatus Latescibacterota bacterium]
MRKRLTKLLEEMASSSVVIIGDVMLDEYIIGDSHRISPEAPEPIIEEQERIYVPGGSANVAVNVTALKAQAKLFSIIGDDTEGQRFRQILKKAGVDDTGIITVEQRPTPRKTRLIARGNQVLRIDRETTEPINRHLEQQLVERITALPENVVVISDYAKGVVTSGLVKSLTDTEKRVIIDPKSMDFSLYRHAYMVTPNYHELCSASGITSGTNDALENAGRKLMSDYDIANILVTLGSNGMLLVEKDGPATHIHTKAREVYDVTGAGDTVVAVIAAAVSAGAPLADACSVATIASGIVVGKHRTATATPEEIMDYAFGPSASEKIVDKKTIIERAAELKKAGKKVVFTNGCFDLLHIGHITYLKEARDLGDALIVGLNTDRSVHRLKGNNRPIIPQEERSHVLAALECVDYVILFDEDTPLELISGIRPDVLVKGANYTREQVVGHDIVESDGGSVILIPVVNNMSTTALIERIKDNF